MYHSDYAFSALARIFSRFKLLVIHYALQYHPSLKQHLCLCRLGGIQNMSMHGPLLGVIHMTFATSISKKPWKVLNCCDKIIPFRADQVLRLLWEGENLALNWVKLEHKDRQSVHEHKFENSAKTFREIKLSASWKMCYLEKKWIHGLIRKNNIIQPDKHSWKSPKLSVGFGKKS